VPRDIGEIGLSAIPALDTHCHPFDRASAELSADLLRDSISVSLRGVTSQLNETMLLSRLAVRELAGFLRCDETVDAVVAARNARSQPDYPGYIADLHRSQKITGLMIDPGFPVDRVIEGTAFTGLVSTPVWEGYRIERFFSPAGSFHGGKDLPPVQSFGTVLEAFEAELDAQAGRPGFAFYKSIIAYRTGLAIQPVTCDEAATAWDGHRAYGDPHEKVIRDYLLHVTCRKAREHGVPLQLHTGHTSHHNPWPNVNPILLTPFLNQPDIGQTRIVLVHGGYPFCTEAGYLTSVYPNLWCDLSLMIPWASVGVSRRIEETLESAPTAKVMYGSDGINIPEMNWLGAIVGRRGLARALASIADAGFLRSADIDEIAADILYRTAESVYDLHSRAPVPSLATAGAALDE